MSEKESVQVYRGRYYFVLGTIALLFCALTWRAVDLQIVDREFLQGQGDARHLRVVSTPAHRGMITDRHGEPLAISTPVESVWAVPEELMQAQAQWPQLARMLSLSLDTLNRRVLRQKDREFVYLRRHITPELAQKVMAMNIPGVSLQREFRRYYPAGEVTGHLIGFTNIDDKGQEGIELLYEPYLKATAGSKRVIKDRLGRIVENVESISEAQPGTDIRLSIDRRIQYLAYRELKSAVKRHKAESASAVVLDATSGEVLAMVNQPAFNPNNRSDLISRRYRNRAVTDLFEPGSTVKPFTIAAALESGRFRPSTMIDTSPGVFRLAGFTIRDVRDFGKIDVSTVIQKSSNVGASRIALSLEPKRLWGILSQVGFGLDTGSGFPGEAGGWLSDYRDWGEIHRVTHSYGYGLSVTPLQLASAYSVLAGDGRLRPVTFLAMDEEEVPAGREVISAESARQVREMMQRVTEPGGTAVSASVSGYHVAGKTGTVRKAEQGGYSESRYHSLFAGMAPATRPRLVMVVKIDEPDSGEYYGGTVAAPVFSRVMEGALRLLDVAPDDLSEFDTKVALVGGAR